MVSLRFLALFWNDFKNWSVDSRFHVETRRKMIVNNSINEEEMGGGGGGGGGGGYFGKERKHLRPYSKELPPSVKITSNEMVIKSNFESNEPI